MDETIGVLAPLLRLKSIDAQVLEQTITTRLPCNFFKSCIESQGRFGAPYVSTPARPGILNVFWTARRPPRLDPNRR